MEESKNLKLKLHGETSSDLALPFLDWREAMNGLENTSNMQIIDAAYGDLKEKTEVIAPEFSTSENYVAGNYVWFRSVLYRFKEDHPAGAWINNDAEVASIHSILDSMSNIEPGENGLTISIEA